MGKKWLVLDKGMGGGRVSSKVDKWWGQKEHINTSYLAEFSLYLAKQNYIIKVDRGKSC